MIIQSIYINNILDINVLDINCINNILEFDGISFVLDIHARTQLSSPSLPPPPSLSRPLSFSLFFLKLIISLACTMDH